jgi:hypothetical protein
MADSQPPNLDFKGVLVSVDADGVYRITWNTSWEGFSSLRGSVFTVSGIAAPFYPGCRDGSCALQGRDTVAVGDFRGRVDFAADRRAAGSRGGFEIEIGNRSVLLVDVVTDGSGDTSRISFLNTDSGQQSPPPQMPFGLTSR